MQSKPVSSCFDQQCKQTIERLNSECHCVSFNRDSFRQQLLIQQGDDQLYKMIVEERPNLIAESAVFVSEPCLTRQRDIIAAIELVIALPGYQQKVLAYAPESALFIPKAHGVFLGYDFHLGPNGPQLIEINTNAGGGLLNVILAQAQTACCSLVDGRRPGDTNTQAIASEQYNADQTFVAMFLHEWQTERGDTPLSSIAIVDEAPFEQFMLPEFLLFKKLFERHHIKTVICDPSELTFRNGSLWHGPLKIDLIYNRLTDFGLEEAAQKTILEAYINGAVVVTPHPRNHALYADKRNLALLTDAKMLAELGVAEEVRSLLLKGIAHTVCVNPNDAENVWAKRKQLFFKPAKGYGSKAAYRGDKMTRRVFSEILQNDYVAQQLVQPSERHLEVDDEVVGFKLDLRNYVYQGHIQLISARLYRGQTTNFRTPGGGFAQVVAVPCTPPDQPD